MFQFFPSSGPPQMSAHRLPRLKQAIASLAESWRINASIALSCRFHPRSIAQGFKKHVNPSNVAPTAHEPGLHQSYRLHLSIVQLVKPNRRDHLPHAHHHFSRFVSRASSACARFGYTLSYCRMACGIWQRDQQIGRCIEQHGLGRRSQALLDRLRHLLRILGPKQRR